MTFRLRAEWVHSLKEKRMIVKSLIVKLHNKFHVSAAEIDEQDTHQIIVIGVAVIVPHNAFADRLMDEISMFIEENCEAEILDEERERLLTNEARFSCMKHSAHGEQIRLDDAAAVWKNEDAVTGEIRAGSALPAKHEEDKHEKSIDCRVCSHRSRSLFCR